jgi:hypothetical protein
VVPACPFNVVRVPVGSPIIAEMLGQLASIQPFEEMIATAEALRCDVVEGTFVIDSDTGVVQDYVPGASIGREGGGERGLGRRDGRGREQRKPRGACVGVRTSTCAFLTPPFPPTEDPSTPPAGAMGVAASPAAPAAGKRAGASKPANKSANKRAGKRARRQVSVSEPSDAETLGSDTSSDSDYVDEDEDEDEGEDDSEEVLGWGF